MASPRLSVILQQLYPAASRGAASVSDQQLLERFVAGKDQSAFTALVQRHGPMVFGICRRLLKELHDAEDAFQATFLVLARQAASIRKGHSLGSWLYGVAFRLARKASVAAQRRSRRERRRPGPATADPADAVTWGELRSVLDEELGRLPPAYRDPLVLCYLQGQTQDEAARHLGWSKATCRRQLERGRQVLKARLVRRGVTLSAGLLAPLLFASAAVPRTLTALTVKAAALFRDGPVGTGIASGPAALAEGLLRGLAWAKGQLAAVLLTVAVVGGAALAVYTSAAQQPAKRPAGKTVARSERASAPADTALPAPVDQLGDPLPAQALARLGTIRFRHGEPARAITFAGDGRSLASAGHDGTIHVWETASGKELLHIENRRFPDLGLGAVLDLAFSPSRKTLAAAYLNEPPCLWIATTGQELRRLGGANYRASWVVFSPDGNTIAYGGGSGDPVIRVADVKTGKEVQQLGGHKGFVTRAAFSPDGKTLATADEAALRLFDVAAGRARMIPQPGGAVIHFTALAYSRDGKTLAAASRASKLIQLLETATGKLLHTIRVVGKRQDVGPIVFTPDGKTLISGHADAVVRLWDTASGSLVRAFRAHRGLAEAVSALALSRDGRALATTINSHIDGDHAVRLWDTATGKPLVRHPGPEQGIGRVVFSPDSKQVATASWEGAIHVWEAATGKLLRHWNRHGTLAFTPRSDALLCGGWTDGTVRVLDLTTGKEARLFSAHAQGIRTLALARDGRTLVTTGNDGFLRLWDVGTGRQLHDFGGKQKSFVFQLALAPDGSQVATIHQDHVLRLWETATGKLVREQQEQSDCGSVAFSPDGKLVATTVTGIGGSPALIRVCEAATGREVWRLQGDGDPLDTMAFSPDGRTLIWGGQHRRELNFWEVATGRLRGRFSGHQGHVTCVAFAPNGRMMASGSSDASVLIWDVAGQRARRQHASAALNAAQIDALWNDLAAQDAALAYRAICTLREAPRQAAALLAQHLKPVPRADAERLARAVRNLDSERFAVRRRATQELEQLGEAAEPALRRALASGPNPELRQRLERLLRRLEADTLRRSRALEVLEHTGDGWARALLTILARGAPGAQLTEDAQAALDRLGR
jgi:RNA polymerase sigma factor (sigma-70 family)